jgi:hypothetical protein
VLYGSSSSRTEEGVQPCADFIAQAGRPALALCGDGYPLFELRERGLEVEGLDSSAVTTATAIEWAAK